MDREATVRGLNNAMEFIEELKAPNSMGIDTFVNAQKQHGDSMMNGIIMDKFVKDGGDLGYIPIKVFGNEYILNAKGGRLETIDRGISMGGGHDFQEACLKISEAADYAIIDYNREMEEKRIDALYSKSAQTYEQTLPENQLIMAMKAIGYELTDENGPSPVFSGGSETRTFDSWGAVEHYLNSTIFPDEMDYEKDRIMNMDSFDLAFERRDIYTPEPNRNSMYDIEYIEDGDYNVTEFTCSDINAARKDLKELWNDFCKENDLDPSCIQSIRTAGEDMELLGYETDTIIKAMDVAGYHYDNINSGSELAFNTETGSTRFGSWADVRDWLGGVVFDDPEISDKVEYIMNGNSEPDVKELAELITRCHDNGLDNALEMCGLHTESGQVMVEDPKGHIVPLKDYPYKESLKASLEMGMENAAFIRGFNKGMENAKETREEPEHKQQDKGMDR